MLDGTSLKVQVAKGSGCYREILLAMKRQLDAVISHYQHVWVFRFDFRVREWTADNKVVSKFMAKLIKWLKTGAYKLLRVGYVWAREQASGACQHYHCALMLDGHKVQYPQVIIDRMNFITEGWDLPPVYVPRNSYYRMRRGDENKYSECFYRLSYLAKESTKLGAGVNANDYSTSRLKIKGV